MKKIVYSFYKDYIWAAPDFHPKSWQKIKEVKTGDFLNSYFCYTITKCDWSCFCFQIPFKKKDAWIIWRISLYLFLGMQSHIGNGEWSFSYAPFWDRFMMQFTRAKVKIYPRRIFVDLKNCYKAEVV